VAILHGEIPMDRRTAARLPLPLLFIGAVVFWHFFQSYCWVRGSSQASFDAGKLMWNVVFMPLFVIHYGWFITEIGAGVALFIIACMNRSSDSHRDSIAKCRACGYSRHGLAGERCPECGARHSAVVPRTSSTGPMVLLVLTCLAATATSVLAGEIWMCVDEHEFNRQASAYAAAGGTAVFARSRAWPIEDCSLVYVPGVGIHATD
jgi:hypothetical protein